MGGIKALKVTTNVGKTMGYLLAMMGFFRV